MPLAQGSKDISSFNFFGIKPEQWAMVSYTNEEAWVAGDGEYYPFNTKKEATSALIRERLKRPIHERLLVGLWSPKI